MVECGAMRFAIGRLIRKRFVLSAARPALCFPYERVCFWQYTGLSETLKKNLINLAE